MLTIRNLKEKRVYVLVALKTITFAFYEIKLV